MALEVVDDIGFPYINKVDVFPFAFAFAFAVYELIFGEMKDRKLQPMICCRQQSKEIRPKFQSDSTVNAKVLVLIQHYWNENLGVHPCFVEIFEECRLLEFKLF
jgi:hypothetical protein